MPAQFTAGLISPHHHGECIPAYQGADPPFDGGIPRAVGLIGRGNGIDVCRRRSEGNVSAAAPGLIDQGLKEKVSTRLAFAFDDRA